MSWDDLEGETQAIELDQKHVDINLLFARTFGTEEGQKVLAWLRDTYLENPSWQPGADSSFGHWREGQNTVIREIEARIKRAKNQ
jgi:hypothetical protein